MPKPDAEQRAQVIAEILHEAADDSIGLLATVLRNPFRLVTGDELKFLIGKSESFIRAARKAGAPFPGGVTRPEWFLKWLEANPKFQIKE